jgi:hypothetical protein
MPTLKLFAYPDRCRAGYRHRAYQCPKLIVPVNEPELCVVVWLNTRSTTTLPDALTNRPVPPVMSRCSVIESVPGVGPGRACPVLVPIMVSPLAATNVKSPTPLIIVMVSTTPFIRNVYLPRCVAVPVAVICTTTVLGGWNTSSSVASKEPWKGNSVPTCDGVCEAAGELCGDASESSAALLDGDVGEPGAPPAQEAAKTHSAIMNCRIAPLLPTKNERYRPGSPFQISGTEAPRGSAQAARSIGPRCPAGSSILDTVERPLRCRDSPILMMLQATMGGRAVVHRSFAAVEPAERFDEIP